MLYDNTDIIVSRYNEDLKWMNEEPFNRFKYIVYNKGSNDDFDKTHVKNIVNLPNVGRCDHTYLYHIVENYSNLARINVFFPGSLNNEYKKNNAKKILYNIILYKRAIFLGTKSSNIKRDFSNFTLDKWVCTDPVNAQLNPEEELLPALLRPYGKWFNYHFGNILVKNWCIHGIFSIQRIDIIKHPKIRYQKLLNGVSRHSNPEVGHYLERSWGAVFHPFLMTKII
jgi:hypothetical protein